MIGFQQVKKVKLYMKQDVLKKIHLALRLEVIVEYTDRLFQKV